MYNIDPTVAIRSRQPSMAAPCHVINLETTDNHAEAKNASILTLTLTHAIHKLANLPRSEDLEDEEEEADDEDMVAVDADELESADRAEKKALRRLHRKLRKETEDNMHEIDEKCNSILSSMSRHLPMPDKGEHHIPMYRWEGEIGTVLSIYEQEIKKTIHHAVLWY